MAFNYSPKIVTDGLVLYLDAGNPRSYASGSTSWLDLSRSQNNGSLVNGPTFNSANGGSFVFDGVDDYVTGSINCNKTIYSIDWWLYPLTTIDYNQVLGFDGSWGSFLFHTTNTGQVYIGTSVTSRITPWRTGVVSINMWQNFTWTFNNGSAIFYKNGAVEISATLSLSTVSSFTSLFIGGNSNNTINGRFSSIKVYSGKALSAQEIQQNYNALKGRYGL